MAQACRPIGCRFSFLPAEFTDRDGRRILLKAQQSGDFFALMRMYEEFEPKGLAQGLPPVDRQLTARWVRQLERDCFPLVAVHDGRIVGHAILTELGQDTSTELAVFVHQAFRRRGLGTQLAQCALRCATTAHCRLLWALVQRYNQAALRICHKAGFSLTEDLLEPDLELRLPLTRTPAPAAPGVDLRLTPDYKPH